jgi:hypothetical protein
MDEEWKRRNETRGKQSMDRRADMPMCWSPGSQRPKRATRQIDASRAHFQILRTETRTSWRVRESEASGTAGGLYDRERTQKLLITGSSAQRSSSPPGVFRKKEKNTLPGELN